MRSINQEQFNDLIKAASNIKPRTKRELRFVASTASIGPEDWHELEIVGITDRTGTKGVLLLEPDTGIFVLPYQLSGGSPDQTGRTQPIICDFCKTWQAGSNSGRITFHKSIRSNDSVTFLCCADLACSNHVRTKTKSSIRSRVHLRESLTNEQRVERLKDRLRMLINDMGLVPISI
jgi:hypothetical protein